MNWALLFTCLLIAVARVTDITLDTIRTVAIVQGRRVFAAILGFVEALVYIIAVAKVLANFDHFVYAIAYAAGFSAGTFLGITLEKRLALGEQLVAIFTRRVGEVAPSLRRWDTALPSSKVAAAMAKSLPCSSKCRAARP